MFISKIYLSKLSQSKSLPFYESVVPAGFPSPAEDHTDLTLDLNDYLIKHPAATFYVYAKGNSMIGSGIHDGDLMIVDRSLNPNSNNIVVAIINGEFTVKKIKKIKNKVYLQPNNNLYEPIEITSDMDFSIWGIVTHVIHKPK